ncbi:MAG: nitrous oxide reductase family maturation protein NosD [Chitinophagaceae bacterium]
MKQLTTITLLLLSMQTIAKTIVVQPTNSINDAISVAQNGDTVLIKKGTYKTGNVVINKSITILGENYPVLDGEDKYEIFTVSGSNILIDGLHFHRSGYSAMNDYAAVDLVDASLVTISNNIFTDNYFGIHVANSSYFTIRGNRLLGLTKTEQTTGNGIHLWKCKYALVEYNESQKHRDGIYFEFVTESLVRRNISHDNIRYGLHFMFSNNDVYSGNTFQNNGAGVAVMFSNHVTMLNNLFDKNWGSSAYGLLLKEISNGAIQHNTFRENTVGIQMEGANNLQVVQNTFQSNGWAARVQASCSANNFQSNNFFSNTFDVATNGQLVLNTFNNNYWDKYDGYDINKDGFGDIPYHPTSMYAMVIEQNPNSVILLRSFMVTLLEKAEKAIPSLTPELLRDEKPIMKPVKL